MEEDYKAKYEKTLEEKQALEAEFGQRRAQFRELFLNCEGQLKREREMNREMELQINDLNRRIEALLADNEGIKTAAKLSEEGKQEEFNALRLKYQDEIASLNRILQEKRERERERGEEKKRVGSPDNRLNSETLMSMIPNPFARKTSAIMQSGKSAVKSADTEKTSLEGAQKQTQQDVDAWRNVVAELEQTNMQLKQEVSSLKKQLKLLEEEKTDEGVESLNDEKVIELQKYLESEKSARSDLEMYVAVLNTQKGVLQEDSDKLRRELHNVCRLFEHEKSSHSELKETWKLANEQFLSQQSKMIYELENMKKLLNPQQLEQLSKLMRAHSIEQEAMQQISKNTKIKPSSSPAMTKKIQSEALEDSPKQPQEEILIRLDNTDGPSEKKKEKSSPSVVKKNIEQPMVQEPTKIKDAIFNTLFPTAYHAKQFTEMMNEKDMKVDSNVQSKPLYLSSSSDSDSSDEDDLERAISKQNQERYQIEEVYTNEGLDKIDKSSLKKSSSSNDILSPVKTVPDSDLAEKSLSQNDVSTNSAMKSMQDEVDNRLEFNESAWSSIGEDLSHTCIMCQNYEKQLQRLQKEYMTITSKDEQLADKVQELQAQLATENDKFASLEKSIESASLDTKSQINIYCTNQEEVDKQVQLLFNQVQEFQMDIHNELRELSESRDRAFAEKTLLKEELDQLKDERFDSVQIKPVSDDMDQIRQEERLQNEILSLKDQIVAEKFDRETTESVLQQDLDRARTEIGKLKQHLDKLSNKQPSESVDLMS